MHPLVNTIQESDDFKAFVDKLQGKTVTIKEESKEESKEGLARKESEEQSKMGGSSPSKTDEQPEAKPVVALHKSGKNEGKPIRIAPLVQSIIEKKLNQGDKPKDRMGQFSRGGAGGPNRKQ